jgi:hypothetical protein
MKKIFIGIFIIIIIAAAFYWFLFHSSPVGTTAQNSSSENPVASSNELSPIYQIPASATITIGTAHGSVTVNNFYKSALGAEDEFIILAKNNDYEINYDTDSSAFYLDIKQAPFDINRASAEANFLNLLGVDQLDACKLTVAVGAEPVVDSGLNGKVSPLSFCASSTFGQ